jgi:predicted enzyme related to lactoylglutathione lyase
MIGGMHTILYSKQPDALRSFFRDVLQFPSVDAGHGWLIFAAPPGELAVHPTEDRAYAELYLLCADLKAEMARLKAKGVEFTMPISEQRWGLVTKLRLPDGESLGLYQPRHPLAIEMAAAEPSAKKATAKRKQRATDKTKSRRR